MTSWMFLAQTQTEKKHFLFHVKHHLYTEEALERVRLKRRLTYTERREIAAGVIPGIRAAWPIDRGRMRTSFSRASRESPSIAV